MTFSLLSVPVYFPMSERVIDCAEKENILMLAMVENFAVSQIANSNRQPLSFAAAPIAEPAPVSIHTGVRA